MSGPVIAAYLLVSDAHGRWLLVYDPASPTGWRLPGRRVSADDESPAAAAVQATAAETGLRLTVGTQIANHWDRSSGCLAMVFASSIGVSDLADPSDCRWRLFGRDVVDPVLPPLISDVLRGMYSSGPIGYFEKSPAARVARLARRGIRTDASLSPSTGVQSTYPCCSHHRAVINQRDVAKLDSPTEQLARRCKSCGTHYLVYLIGAASEPEALEWFVFG